MKYSYTAVALVVAVAQAQQIPNIPPCGLQCLITANTGCASLTDFACQCRQSQLIPQVLPCVQENCSPSEQQALREGITNLCQSVGVPITIPEDGAAAEDTAAATEAAPTEAAPTEAAPTEAAATEAAPTEAAPTDAAPTDAAPTDAAPTEDTAAATTAAAAPEETVAAEEDEEVVDTTTEVVVAATEQTTVVAPTIAVPTTGAARPTGAPTGNVTSPTAVTPPFEGGASQVVGFGSVGGLVAFLLAAAAVYAL